MPETKAKHTPGPWGTAVPKDSLANRIIDPDGRLDIGVGAEVEGKRVIIAEAFGRVASSVYVNAQANARLIAAAPDLLGLVYHIRNYCHIKGIADDPALKELSETAHTTISKAEGQ